MVEHELPSDDVIQAILGRAMEEQFSKARPAARHFFDHDTPSADQSRAVTFHQWATAELSYGDSIEAVAHLASRCVKEVVAVADKLTCELTFTISGLLPTQPTWSDGSGLFATHNEVGNDRFDVIDGNLIRSVNCFSADIVRAAERLDDLDENYTTGDERLQLFCAKPLEKKLIKASVKAGVPCRVFGLYDHKDERSWVLTRDSSACSLLIGKPAFDLPVKGNKLIVGARFVVRVINPRLAVRVSPTQ